MDNQCLFIIILGIVLLYITHAFYYSDNFVSDLLYPQNIIDCSGYTNSEQCNNGYKCTWIDEKLKAFPLNTPFCTGNVLDVF